MNLTFSRPRAVERRNQWERIKGDLPPPLTPITRSADPSFHRSTGDDRAHSSSSLARFAYAPFSLYEVYEGVNERAATPIGMEGEATLRGLIMLTTKSVPSLH